MMITLKKIETAFQYLVYGVAVTLLCMQGVYTVNLLHKGESIWPQLTSCILPTGNTTQAVRPRKIAFFLGADIPALHSQKKGILDMLHTHDVPTEEIVYYHNQDTLLLENQVEAAIEKNVDLVVTVGSMAARAAHARLLKAGGRIPLLFSCVMLTDKDGISKGREYTGYNSTGTSDGIMTKYSDMYARAITTVRPGAQKALIIFNPTGIPMLEKQVNELCESLKTVGVTTDQLKTYSCGEVYEKARSRITPETDVVITLRDYTTTSALQALRKLCYKTKTTLFASDSHSTKCGAAASLSINEYELGLISGAQALQILKDGKPAGSLPIVYFQTQELLRLQINPFELRKQGINQQIGDLLAAKRVSVVVPDAS